MTMLVILSGQRSYFGSGGPNKEILPKIVTCAQKVRAAGGFVFLDREIRDVEDSFFFGHETENIVGTPGIDYMQSLIPVASTSSQSSLLDRSRLGRLLSEIRKHNPDRVFVCGAETHAAVLLTAYGLKVHGVDVHVVEPLCFSREEYLHSSAIAILADGYKIEVVDGIY